MKIAFNISEVKLSKLNYSFSLLNLIFSIVLFFISLQTISQNIEFKSSNFPDKKKEFNAALNDLKEGDKLFEKGENNHQKALVFFLKANEFNPNSALLNYKTGVCYLAMPDKSAAVTFLQKAVQLDSNVSDDIYYMLGQALHQNLQFEKAIANFLVYKEKRMGMLSPEETKELDKKIVECKNGIELLKDPKHVFVDNIGATVNSAYPDYGPYINADETMLIFTSRRPNTTGGGVDNNDGNFFEDIYISYNDSGKWETPINPGKPLNTDKHDANVGISVDGQRLFIYKDENGGDIFQCYLKGDQWSKPIKLPPPVNTEFYEPRASFSYDERTIYFISDRPGGYGGTDIYLCEISADGKLSEAVNLGPKINTAYDEKGVFMQPDGRTLYFSSEGHNTMGGADIFKATYDHGQWSEPINMGFPINTPGDDLDFSITANGRHGYYSSIKADGLGDNDIYKITFISDKQLAINNEDNLLASVAEPTQDRVINKSEAEALSKVTVLKGVVLDENNLPLEAEIKITDNTTNTIIATFKTNNKTGKYLISLPSGKNYGITVEAENFLFYSENFDIDAGSSFKEVAMNVPLKKAELGNKIILNNIFFEFSKADLNPMSIAELNRLIKLLNDMPSIKIEISGHTDNIGSEQYNLSLSDNRAIAVSDYITSHGIIKSRITPKGYAFSQPLFPNDSDEHRKKNRRTEFKIIGQ